MVCKFLYKRDCNIFIEWNIILDPGIVESVNKQKLCCTTICLISHISVSWYLSTSTVAHLCQLVFSWVLLLYIKSILQKGPYLPCVSMPGRALLAGHNLLNDIFSFKGPCYMRMCFQINKQDIAESIISISSNSSHRIEYAKYSIVHQLSICYLLHPDDNWILHQFIYSVRRIIPRQSLHSIVFIIILSGINCYPAYILRATESQEPGTSMAQNRLQESHPITIISTKMGWRIVLNHIAIFLVDGFLKMQYASGLPHLGTHLCVSVLGPLWFMWLFLIFSWSGKLHKLMATHCWLELYKQRVLMWLSLCQNQS